MVDASVCELLADDSQFRQWLMSRQMEIVGYVGSTGGCPLANWLFACTGRMYHVSRNYYGIAEQRTALPSWAWHFVQLLEVLPEEPVCGQDALDVLNGILPWPWLE